MKFVVAVLVSLILTFGAGLSISNASDQPDFHMDCHAARTNNEQFICADEDLLRRDAQMGEVSDKLYAVLDAPARAEMAREFAEWLATRDDCEDNYFCNAGMYSDRIAYLQQELDHMDAPGFVQKSAPVDTDGFGLVANAGIPGHNKETYPALTIEICKSICVQRPWCKSIDFDRTNGACYVQPVAEEDVGALRTDYPGHPYDHYFYAPRLRN
ncbi:PAN domain-containing protein [uncultured Roseibium sp.]|uniref:PAN domain-containing protein n=1 Tax=uncultured Roseibium sp. TaxID=1936171 RepID=UPI002628E2FF|nr:PAN domain-containing protein [uncultured Roseibium sp.]